MFRHECGRLICQWCADVSENNKVKQYSLMSFVNPLCQTHEHTTLLWKSTWQHKPHSFIVTWLAGLNRREIPRPDNLRQMLFSKHRSATAWSQEPMIDNHQGDLKLCAYQYIIRPSVMNDPSLVLPVLLHFPSGSILTVLYIHSGCKPTLFTSDLDFRHSRTKASYLAK